MRAAVVVAGVVVNVIIIDPENPILIEGATVIPSETANIGDRWDGSSFSPP